MKIREKTKLKTIIVEEIPLEEPEPLPSLEGQLLVESELIIYCSHSYNMQQITYVMTYYMSDMLCIICYES